MNPSPLPLQIESLETKIEFKQSNRAADFIRGEEDNQEQYIRQGKLLHYVFASIEKESDMPQAFERLRFEGVLETEEQEMQIRKLATWAMNHPKVKDWYSGEWTLYNECSIIYLDEDGTMQTRRPDRVMMKNGEAVVVDFKFGNKKETYNEQVRQYMNLLAHMGYKHIRGYLWYVFANELEEVSWKHS